MQPIRLARNTHVHLFSPLTCLRLLEFGAGIGLACCAVACGIMFSSFFGEPCIDCCEVRPDVVRGSRLFVAAPFPLTTADVLFSPSPSLLAGLYERRPLAALRSLGSRSSK